MALSYRTKGSRGRIVEKEPVCGTLEVVVLAGLQGPSEGGEPEEAEKQGCGDQIEERAHGRT
jgi:hypothetical protein